MEIIVCVKQVPGTSQVEVDPVTGILRREGVDSKLNPYDLYAIETALTLAEKYGGSVYTVSMGPAQAKAALLETVYMGASGGLLVSDRAFAGSDVLATAYTLSQAIRKMGRFDLILCGKQTTDGDTAQVGAEIAEFLGIPHAGNVMAISDVTGGDAMVSVNLDACIASQRMPLPSLLCMDAEVNTPRLPSYLKRKRTAEEAVETVSLADFEDGDKAHYGLSGSATKVERIFPPEKNVSREVLTGGNAELAHKLYGVLRQRKFI